MLFFFNQQSHISCGPAPWTKLTIHRGRLEKKTFILSIKLFIMVNEFPLHYIYIYIYHIISYHIISYFIISYITYYILHITCYILHITYYILHITYYILHTYPKMVFVHPAMFGFKMVSLNSRTKNRHQMCTVSPPCSIA